MDIRTKNYNKAKNSLDKYLGSSPDVQIIQEIHAIVVEKDEPYRSGGTLCPVKNVDLNIVYLAPNSLSIDIKLKVQIFLIDLDSKQLPNDIYLATLHWGIVKIHPFEDGNGRLARLLVILMMRKRGFSPEQCDNFEKFIATNKNSYYDALDDGVLTHDTFDTPSHKWLEFIKIALSSQFEK